MTQPQILVLDFGSQYTQLIARRLREVGVYTEIVPYFEGIDSIRAKSPRGLILSGGPASVYEKDAPKPSPAIFELNIPVLGICYGMQFIAQHFGGRVKKAAAQEFGRARLELLGRGDFGQKNAGQTLLFDGVKQDSVVWMSHADCVESIPQGFSELAKSGNTHFCAIADVSRQIYALQFHPEVVHSECGEVILRNFALQICGADSSWSMKNFAAAEVAKLREIVLGSEDSPMNPRFAAKAEFFNQMGEGAATKCLVEIWESGARFTHEDLSEAEIAGMRSEIEAGILGTKNLLVATLNAVPVGFITTERNEITMLFVAPSAFKKGLGKALVREALVRYLGDFETIKVGSIAWALGFYQDLGFKKVRESREIRERRSEFSPELIALEIQRKKLQEALRGKIHTAKNASSAAANHTKFANPKSSSKVLCAVSGGVDSSVVAALLYRAIGENLIPVFVDTGLLRKGEREAVEKMFKENLKVPLITADASALFLRKLKGVLDPEKKRKIIGETFIQVFEKEARKHNTKGEIKFLAQGTLYPDVIESVSVKGPSKTIKSHHNVGGLPEWMKFELIEPLRELFKDEVRALGRELGMPESMLMRHPFPGPGLAIRIMGEVNKTDLDLLREADSIFIDELQKQGYYDKVWQAFCVLLNVRSVGVMGDNRTYDNTICVRAVEAIDGMTATFAHLPHDFLESVSNRIINEVEGINRVVYDITSKPPGTIEWE